MSGEKGPGGIGEDAQIIDTNKLWNEATSAERAKAQALGLEAPAPNSGVPVETSHPEAPTRIIEAEHPTAIIDTKKRGGFFGRMRDLLKGK